MKFDRRSSAKKNIIWGIVSRVILSLFPFVIRWCMINYIGAEYLGLDSLFVSILQIINLAELGISNAIIFSMYKPVADGDKNKLCALLNFYKLIYRKIGLFIMLVGIIWLPFLPSIIKGGYPDDVNIYYLYLIHLINASISYWLYAYKQSVLEVYLRNDLISKINISISFLSLILRCISIVVFNNIYIYSCVMILGTIITNIYVSYYTNKLFPDIVCRGSIDYYSLNDIKIRVKGLLIGKICDISRNAIGNICISLLLGLLSITIYNNYFTIMMGVRGILNIPINAIQAIIGNIIASENKEIQYRFLIKLDFMFMWITGFCVIIMGCLYQPVIEFIYGKDMLLPFRTMLLFCVYIYIMCTGCVITMFVSGGGIWWEHRKRNIVECLINIFLTYVLGYFLQIEGILLSALIGVAICGMAWGVKITFSRLFGDASVKEYWCNHLKYFLSTGIVFSITYFLFNEITGNNFIEWFIKIFILIVIPNILYNLIYSGMYMYKDAKEFMVNTIINR